MSLKVFWLVLMLALLVLCSRIDIGEARKGRHWRPRRGASSASLAKKKAKGKVGNGGGHHHHKGGAINRPSPDHKPVKPTPTPNPNPSPSPKPGKGGYLPSPRSVMFNVLDFGAKGNGVSDDTKAFQGAWASACKVAASTVLVPWGYKFLVGPISFSGPYCQPNIVFQLDGIIIAPTSPKAWGSGLLQWLEFTKLRGITIQGRGVIEGRGSVWWTYSQWDDEPISTELSGNMPSIKPTALRFYGSYNVTVTGITIQNSPQCHLKFDNCEAVQVYNMSVSSPGNSLNTDGIHLQNSRSIAIHHVDLACGDDCVSIQTGCSDVKIHSIHCGPGHGISIGSLGRDHTKACVSNITVQDIDIHNTMTGVRIKTWQGGSGSVQGVKFTNIRMYEVQTPIIIDQFYCDKSTCMNQTSAVALSGISYESIRGTYTVKPVHFACSDIIPCSDISLSEIELKPIQEQYHMYDPFCWQAFGELFTPTIPPIFCLQNGKPTSNRIQSGDDTC
ncbi:uncharacterized protein A4U43_C05F13380 [Asparagus officinalis]|uniref:Polygalacturonase n=1 Tax=Asparagus officinalis TaxID=4686 RepID=A0A5P1ESD4_ASPOF|nr:polygalacturonase At1g48100-like [Asparagus officinalis]ONK68563.1 uncharacterized protein A4U43_C05F13380 [Asparagus officinalis]